MKHRGIAVPLLVGTLSWALLSPLDSASAATSRDPSLFQALAWRSIGPYRGGRVTAVAGVPGDPLVYYFGATGGGVFKTTDAGLNWRPIGDRFFKTGSVGAVAVAPSDANVIYVGTGEACIRSNFSHGDGVYKSVDAGATWTHMGLSDSRQIGKIRVDPRDPDRVYVAALGRPFGPSHERGVFRSQDGGRTWEKVLFVDENTGAVDVDLDRSNPRILFAAFWQVHRKPWGIFSGGPGSGLYRSSDGGDTWTELTEGLPKGIKGRIGVAVSPALAGRVWAMVEAEDGGLFRSDDGGKSWRRWNDESKLRERAWYYSHVIADTEDPNTVYVLTLQLFKSIDGGRRFDSIRTPHGDNHDLWIAPEDNRRMINSNDGGVNVSWNGGESWTRQDNQPTGQFYHVTTDNQFPYRVYGAQQDNSTVSIPSRSSGFGIDREDWYPVGGGESGYIAPRRDDPNIVYAGSFYGLLTRYDHRTGATRNITVWPVTPGGRPAAEMKYRFQWTFPIIASMHDPEAVYVGANVLFKSTNGGESWEAVSPDLTRNDKEKQDYVGGPLTGDNSSADYYDTIFTVAESPRRAGLLWVGTDDGRVHVTRDGGASWTDVTPRAMAEWSRVSLVEASPHHEGAAYLAVNRYPLDDFKPYVYKTTDYGGSWKLVTGGIREDAFVRAVREDPKRRGLLYAGTETGVYVSFDDGESWQSLQLNLPVVPVTDLAVREDDLVISTQGRGFWILDDLTPLHQLTDEVAAREQHLFEPRAAYRILGGGGGGGGPSQGVGQNPPLGVVVHYALKDEPQGPVTLEFLDAGGTPVRRFSSQPAPEARGPEDPLAGFFGEARGSERVPVARGLNRFVWDMRYPGASRPPAGTILFGASVRGPLAVPGTYQVRLTAGGRSETRTFEIRKDPRLSTTDEDFRKQFDLLIQIRDRVSQAHDTANRLLEWRQQLETARSRAVEAGHEESVAPAARELDQKLSSAFEELIQPELKRGNDVLSHPVRLNNLLASIGSVVGSSEAAPTDQAYDAFGELSAKLDLVLSGVRALERDIAGFNNQLRDLGVPAIGIPPREP